MRSKQSVARPLPDTTAFLTVEEFAARLRICRATAYRLIQSGRVRTVKLGRRTLVHRDVVEAIVAEVAASGMPVLSRSDSDTTPAA